MVRAGDLEETFFITCDPLINATNVRKQSGEKRVTAARYLVTGGAGFIGSHIAAALAARGERVRIFDNLATGREANLAAVARWVERTPWADFLAEDPATRSCTSICLKAPKEIAAVLEKEGVAYDIASYRDAPAGLRIWGGATVDTADIEALLLWLDWAHGMVTATAQPKAGE